MKTKLYLPISLIIILASCNEVHQGLVFLRTLIKFDKLEQEKEVVGNEGYVIFSQSKLKDTLNYSYNEIKVVCNEEISTKIKLINTITKDENFDKRETYVKFLYYTDSLLIKPYKTEVIQYDPQNNAYLYRQWKICCQY